MSYQLQGRVIVVTGGARGMGAATVRTLIAQGAKVIATDVLKPQESLDGAEFIAHDVSSEADWRTVFDTVAERFGTLNGLVNNAGIAEPGSLLDTDIKMVEKAFRVNQTGVFLGMQNAAKMMKESGGAIVNLASCVAMRGVVDQFAYAASKWAVRGMTKCAALELAQYNIRVNAINPGPVDTPMIAVFDEDTRMAMRDQIPLGRLGKPKDIASAVSFLLSDDASFISGAELDVDGGLFA
jgi:3alpha(or 20beta)-hydroxysteroid dehydrogenase